MILIVLDEVGNCLDILAFYEKLIDSFCVIMDKYFLVINGEVDGKVLWFGLDFGVEFNFLYYCVNWVIFDYFKISRWIYLVGMFG